MASKGKNLRRAGFVGIVVLVGWLISLLPNLQGPGDGEGKGKADQEQTKNDPKNTQVSLASDANPITDSTPDEPDQEPGNFEIVDVLVDGHEYRVRTGTDSQQTPELMPLSQIVELARQAEGTELGIRVRVRRRATARAKAEEDLLRALADAGIPEDSIVVPNEVADD